MRKRNEPGKGANVQCLHERIGLLMVRGQFRSALDLLDRVIEDPLPLFQGETYNGFLDRSASTPIARWMKLADFDENMNLRDLSGVTPRDAETLSKCVVAWDCLNET